jgi:lysophospholipase L1-like esterase
MKKALLIISLIFSVAFGQTNKIVVDGNSYTVGYPSYTSFADIIATHYAITVTNLGVSGQTTNQMLADEYSQVLPLYDATKVNIIPLVEGGNDIYYWGDVDSAVARYIRYATIAKAAGFKVIASTTIPRNQTTSFGDNPTQYNTKLSEFNSGIIAASGSFDAIIRPDTAAIFQTYTSGGYDSDNVHPNQTGQQKFADLFISAINSLQAPIIIRGRKAVIQ